MSVPKASRTVMFSDITDSTGLYEALGDEGGRSLVLECVDLMQQGVERHSGSVVDRIGDELLSTFPDAASAGRASCEIHRAIEAAGAGFPSRVSVRIGFHEGPLILQENQIFGDTIHIARRVASLAKPQQTLTTGQTKEQIPTTEPLLMRFVDRTRLQGKVEVFELFEIVWDEGAATANEGPLGPETGSGQPILRVDCGGQTYQLDATNPVLKLGRDSSVDVVFDHSKVSRFHARIEHRKGRFVFVDQSTNGSQVVERHGPRHFVRRDECTLVSRGTIVLGPEEPGSEFPSVGYRLVFEEPG